MIPTSHSNALQTASSPHPSRKEGPGTSVRQPHFPPRRSPLPLDRVARRPGRPVPSWPVRAANEVPGQEARRDGQRKVEVLSGRGALLRVHRRGSSPDGPQPEEARGQAAAEARELLVRVLKDYSLGSSWFVPRRRRRGRRGGVAPRSRRTRREAAQEEAVASESAGSDDA